MRKFLAFAVAAGTASAALAFGAGPVSAAPPPSTVSPGAPDNSHKTVPTTGSTHYNNYNTTHYNKYNTVHHTTSHTTNYNNYRTTNYNTYHTDNYNTGGFQLRNIPLIGSLLGGIGQ
jgi:hypothetical protein